MNQKDINKIPVKDAEVVKICKCEICQCKKAKADDITTLEQIDDSSKEGKYLLMALSKITTESQRNKTPDEVLSQLTELKNKVYADS